MNFDEALKTHVGWKMKLQGYLTKPDGSINVAELTADNRCELGKWIYGEGSHYAGVPEYRTLKNEHARFHKAAGSVVNRANAGQKVQGEIELGSSSEFASASQGVVSAIMMLRPKVK